jgi:hypothetical protein
MTGMLRHVVKKIAQSAGLEIRRANSGGRYEKNMMYEADARYHELRAKGLAKTGSPDGKAKSIEKPSRGLEASCSATRCAKPTRVSMAAAFTSSTPSRV